VTWKKALLVALVVLLVLVGLPLLMPGMSGAAGCADCGPAVVGGASCGLVGFLAAAVLAIALLAQVLATRRDDLADLLLAAVFERPPQLA